MRSNRLLYKRKFRFRSQYFATAKAITIIKYPEHNIKTSKKMFLRR